MPCIWDSTHLSDPIACAPSTAQPCPKWNVSTLDLVLWEACSGHISWALIFFLIVKPSSCLKSLHSSWENWNSLNLDKQRTVPYSCSYQAVLGPFSGISCSIQRGFCAINNLSWMASLSPFPGGGCSCPPHSLLLMQPGENCCLETSLL